MSPVIFRPLSSISTWLFVSPFILRYDPMALGENDSDGTIIVSASCSPFIPELFISRPVITSTGTGVAFSLWCTPVPVTTTGLRS